MSFLPVTTAATAITSSIPSTFSSLPKPKPNNENIVATEFKVHTVAKQTLKRKATSPTLKATGTRSQPASRPIARPVARLATTTQSSTAKTRTNTRSSAAKSLSTAKINVSSKAAAEPARKKKRADWDTKGRLGDLEEAYTDTKSKLDTSSKLVSDMSTSLETSQQSISDLINFKKSLESTVHVKEMENKDISEQLESQHKVYEDKLDVSKSTIDRLTNEATIASKEYTDKVGILEQKLDEGSEANRLSKLEIGHLKNAITELTSAQVGLEARAGALKIKVETTEDIVSSQSIKIKGQESMIASHIDIIASLESKIRVDEAIRKKLHNTIQELKGNIRVFCRVRPLLPADSSSSDTHIMYPEARTIEFIQTSDSAAGAPISKKYPFTFDKVFQPDVGQAEVFEEISQLVQSVLDGYNVCIFAYGQTGSGKTYTMEGPGVEDPNTTGMIARAVSQIFESAQSLVDKGWSYTMQASFLEIYNETIRDLLASGSDAAPKLDIKHDKCKTSVVGATVISVDNSAQVEALLTKARGNRAVAATNCNERSSRSHSVFILKLSGSNSITGESTSAALNLVDLAGSERLGSSGSTGDRLRETQAINKSLSALGDVVVSLANRDSHIPYRNSKLTYLLQNSLGGNCKTLMFVAVNPHASSLGESLCSLRFASKVNGCDIGSARVVKK